MSAVIAARANARCWATEALAGAVAPVARRHKNIRKRGGYQLIPAPLRQGCCSQSLDLEVVVTTRARATGLACRRRCGGTLKDLAELVAVLGHEVLTAGHAPLALGVHHVDHDVQGACLLRLTRALLVDGVFLDDIPAGERHNSQIGRDKTFASLSSRMLSLLS